MINTRYKIRETRYQQRAAIRGFTLVELLIALSVSGIIMTAVATLAFALSSAYNSTEDTSEKQAQVRYTTLKINDLVRHSRLVCFLGSDDIALWSADKNSNNRINISELVYIEKGSGSDHLRIYKFPVSVTDPNINLGDIGSFSSRWWSSYVSEANEPIDLIPECGKVQFSFYENESPPRSRFVSITFEMTEDGTVRKYEIDGAIRNWAGNLLNSTGTAIVSDDD